MRGFQLISIEKMRRYKIFLRTAWWLLKARCANKPFVGKEMGEIA